MKMHRFSSLSVKGLGVSLLLTVAPTRAGERTIKASLVPAAVHEAVKRKYPDARVIGYTKETEKGKITYEVTLRVGGHVTDVGVTSEGMIVVEEERIMANELPVAVARRSRRRRMGVNESSALSESWRGGTRLTRASRSSLRTARTRSS